MFSFNELKKAVKNKPSSKAIKIAVLADHPSQLMHTAIEGFGATAGFNFEIYEADINQIEQEILNPFSGLYSFEADYIFISISVQQLQIQFYETATTARTTFAEAYLVQLKNFITTIKSSGKSKIILSNLIELNDSIFGNFANKTAHSFLFQIRKLNAELMQWSSIEPSLFILDVQSLAMQSVFSATFAAPLYIQTSMVFSLDFLPLMAKHFTDIISAIQGKFKKCVVIDLDNTMWGGIVGDDGWENLQIGNLGIGKAFSHFQHWLKELKHRGIILCVCSKNTESIAKEAFEKHPDMVLKLNDIAVFVANWENKADNIRYIQSVLNIGLDSFVFLDDNPFERNLVRKEMPEVAVPELPEDPAEYVIFLQTENLFETASFTEEDNIRTQKYKEEADRTILKQKFTNEKDYLNSLEMEALIEPFNNFTIPRVAQLSQRSNQFNLRTIRYTEDEIKNIAQQKNYHTIAINLKDKYGDYGLISTIILQQTDDQNLFVDTWIMSCRVLKREVEKLALNHILAQAKKLNCHKIVGEYIATPKNGLVKNHYADLGFFEKNNQWILDCENVSTFDVSIKIQEKK